MNNGGEQTMTDIRKQLEELKTDIKDIITYDRIKEAEHRVNDILDSLPQEEEEIPEGHLVACSDGDEPLGTKRKVIDGHTIQMQIMQRRWGEGS